MKRRWFRRSPPTASPVVGAQEPSPFLVPYDGAASAEDVFRCFRLLLGRHPARAELVGHMSQVGQPLDRVVAGYLGSREFKIRQLAAPESNEVELVSTTEGFSMFVSREDAAVGAEIAGSGRYEPHVTGVFLDRLRPGMRVVDIGANIGWFSLLAASRVGATGHVTAVEPNPANARMLEASRRANGFGNLLLLPVAAGRDHGAVALYRTYSNGTTSSLDGVAILDCEIVPAIRLDDVLADRTERVGLVKADAEGAEPLALGGMERTLRRDKPVVICEFSPGMMPGVSGMTGLHYLEWLAGLGYRLGVITRDGSVAYCTALGEIVAAHEASGVDHIDLVAEPD